MAEPATRMMAKTSLPPSRARPLHSGQVASLWSSGLTDSQPMRRERGVQLHSFDTP